MPAADSISDWYDRLRAGDEAAALALWDRYFPRLVGLARARLAGFRRRAAADEEDVALSAFDSFCRRARDDGFPEVANRDDLWRVISTVVARKAARLVRDQSRLKRRGAAGESALDRPGAPPAGGLDGVPGHESPPDVEAELADDLVHLLDALDSPELRLIALWKMDGRTNPEIARLLDCSTPTVERRLALIRKTWERAAEDPPG